MTWIILYFDKQSEELIGKIKIPNIPLKKMQEVFNIPQSNPMYDSYIIGPNEANFFKSIDITIYLDKFDYFLDHTG